MGHSPQSSWSDKLSLSCHLRRIAGTRRGYMACLFRGWGQGEVPCRIDSRLGCWPLRASPPPPAEDIWRPDRTPCRFQPQRRLLSRRRPVRRRRPRRRRCRKRKPWSAIRRSLRHPQPPNRWPGAANRVAHNQPHRRRVLRPHAAQIPRLSRIHGHRVRRSSRRHPLRLRRRRSVRSRIWVQYRSRRGRPKRQNRPSKSSWSRATPWSACNSITAFRARRPASRIAWMRTSPATSR